MSRAVGAGPGGRRSATCFCIINATRPKSTTTRYRKAKQNHKSRRGEHTCPNLAAVSKSFSKSPKATLLCLRYAQSRLPQQHCSVSLSSHKLFLDDDEKGIITFSDPSLTEVCGMCVEVIKLAVGLLVLVVLLVGVQGRSCISRSPPLSSSWALVAFSVSWSCCRSIMVSCPSVHSRTVYPLEMDCEGTLFLSFFPYTRCLTGLRANKTIHVS
jgi:hypothetical protein